MSGESCSRLEQPGARPHHRVVTEPTATDATLDALRDALRRLAPNTGWNRTALEELQVFRADSPIARSSELVSRPSLCLVAQGSKRGFLGNWSYRYDVATYAVITRPLEIEAEVLEATPERPFLSIGLALGREVLADLLTDLAVSSPAKEPVWLEPVGEALLGAVGRLVGSLAEPLECRVLAPLVVREIAFRVLVGRQGPRLAAATRRSLAHEPILRAIRRLHDEYAQPISVPELASRVGMSASVFHRSFKQSTGTTPARYLRQIRLEQGRRLIEVLGLDVGEAAYRVGYGDPSRFSRDFRRRWGARPSEIKSS
jgi:AraC-like DNA-binding protein